MSASLPQLGRYRVLRPLGSGAMGDVFLAEDPQIERQLAIKTVRLAGGDRVDHEERRERLLREAKAAGRIHHPNVVTLFDVGESGGLLYLVFEYVAGMDLAARARSAPPLTLGDVLRLGREVATALDAAHRQGIVHRDIKPTNVLIGPHGEAKVTDFGIAKLARATELTQTGSVVGSPQYMSPEQVRGEALDGRSDLFALGVLLYELLTRKRPFDGESLTTLVYQILSQEPAPVEAVHPGLPHPVAALVRRLMAKDPAARPASAGEVAEELGRIAAALPAERLAAPAAPADLESDSTLRLAATPTPARAAPAATPSATWALPGGSGSTAPMPPPPPPPTAAPGYRPGPAVVASRRRGSGLLVAAVAILTAIAAGAGAVWWWSRTAPPTAPPTAAADEVTVTDAATEDSAATADPASPASSALPPALAPPRVVEAPPPAEGRREVREPAPGSREEPAPPPAPPPPAPATRRQQAPPEPARSAPPTAPPSTTPPSTTLPAPAAADPAPPPPSATSRGEERWQRAASAAARELSTGLALRLAVEPEDAYVRIWRRGDERSVVRGQAREFGAGKDGRPLDLPGDGDYVLTLLREGLPDAVYLIHAASGGGAATIAANLRSTASRGPRLVVVEQSVAFSGTPEAEVWLDGRRVGTTSDWPGGLFAGGEKSLQLTNGDHTIRLVAPGHEPLEIRVEVRSEVGLKRATIEYRL